MAVKNIYIAYRQKYSGGEICEGQENDSWPSHEDTVIDLSLRFASLEVPSGTPHFDIETIEADADLSDGCVYAVLVRYYDGDTFGRTCGYHCFRGVYASSGEAGAKKREIENLVAANIGRRYDGNPWSGYFAGFEGVTVVRLTLQ